MDETQWLAERFEQHRPRLRAVAYRMLGSLAEADDAVQDAWLRLSHANAEPIGNLGGWLTTVVARECLHTLSARRHRREDPFAAHLPDPLVIPDGDLDPEQEALLAKGWASPCADRSLTGPTCSGQLQHPVLLMMPTLRCSPGHPRRPGLAIPGIGRRACHHGSGPSSRKNAPVGPSSPTVARRTAISAPCAAVRKPVWPLASVSHQPGSQALTLIGVSHSSLA
jgi:hypothetical protein